jgi:predicted metal-dependent hydrolase
VHEAYNELLRKQGYHFRKFEAFEERLSRFFARESLKTRLALCACGEFFTAVMGRHLVETGICETPGVDERMRALWTWHSLEELDHRGTAFEMYRAFGGGYVRRVALMLLMTALYFVTHLLCFRALLRQDAVRLSSSQRQAARSFLVGRRGFYRSVLGPWIRFFMFGFRPERDIVLASGVARELHHIHIEEHFRSALSA